MLLFTSPFLAAAVLLYIGANPYAALAVAWFIMVSVIRGLTTGGGVVGEE
jgi:hypothetical protein